MILLFIGMSSNTFGQPVSIHDKAVESLKKMFGDSINVTQMRFILTPEDKQLIANSSKTRWANDTLTLYTCGKGNQIMGYGFLDNVKGKMQFITYLVGVLPNGGTKDVDVLAYRESYGGEIGYESFRKQFRGKTANDELRPGSTIKNISGATISVRAITYGVQRVLTTFPVIKQRIVN